MLPLQIDSIRRHDLNLLVTLRVLLSTSSVSSTAKVLGVSQSTVSKALERLRAEFRDPLLVRSSNRMFLTERAKLLMPSVEAAFDDIEQIFGGAEVFDPHTAARVSTVGANEYMQATIAARVILRLQREAPGARLNFRPMASNVPALLADGTLDMVVGTDTHESRGLRSRVLYADDFVCVAGRDQPGRPRTLTLPQFAAWPQIDISPSGLGMLPRIVEQRLFKNGESRNVVAMLSSYFALPGVLNRLDAISLVPRRVFEAFTFDDMLEPVKLQFAAPQFEVRMYWHNVTHADPFHVWLRDLISEVAAEPRAGEATMTRTGGDG